MARRGAHDVGQITHEQVFDQLPDAVPPSYVGHQVGLDFDAVQRVRDRDRAAAHREKRVVVLGIADADHVVRRQTTLGQGGDEPACLVDAGGQDHDRALVEHDRQLEAELANRIENDVLHRLPAGDDTAADRQRMHAALSQPRDERLRRRRRQHPSRDQSPAHREAHHSRPRSDRSSPGQERRVASPAARDP